MFLVPPPSTCFDTVNYTVTNITSVVEWNLKQVDFCWLDTGILQSNFMHCKWLGFYGWMHLKNRCYSRLSWLHCCCHLSTKCPEWGWYAEARSILLVWRGEQQQRFVSAPDRLFINDFEHWTDARVWMSVWNPSFTETHSPFSREQWGETFCSQTVQGKRS